MSENAAVNEAAETPEADQSVDQLPEWARKQITEANQEAAKYRIKAKEVAEETKARLEAEFAEQLKAVADEKSAITAERDAAVLQLEKLRAVLEAGVPGEHAFTFADLIQGSAPEEIRENVQKLLTIAGSAGTRRSTAAVDRSAGMGSAASASDPAEAFGRALLGMLNK